MVGVGCPDPRTLPSSEPSEKAGLLPEAISSDHKWVGATHVPLDEKQARWASHRGSIRIPPGEDGEQLKVEVLDVYCLQCRRVFGDVASGCSAADTTEHLRGGPIGERRRRKHPWHDCYAYDCTEPLPAGFTREGSGASTITAHG